jgi:hypothetical protein
VARGSIKLGKRAGRPVCACPYDSPARLDKRDYKPHEKHVAQLGVYLRLNGVPVPALYGPSADEQWSTK